MKNVLIYLFLIAIASSCSKDDSAAIVPQGNDPIENEATLPKVILLNGATDVFEGVVGAPTQSALQYTVEATAAAGFISLEIFKVVDGAPQPYEIVDSSSSQFVAGSDVQTYSLNYILNEADAGHSLSFKAVVTDANNQKDNLIFAQAEVRNPMIQSTVQLSTKVTPVGDITIPYYLLIDENNIMAVNHDIAVNVTTDQNIAAVFSVNEGSGFYIVSPSSVLETVIVNGMQEKATTKFKDANAQFINPLSNHYTIYDVFTMEGHYASLEFNAHEEKAEQVSTVGKRYYFSTDENRVGAFQVTNFELNGDDATITLDLFITQ